jgi:hypothetical protein
MNLNLIGSNSFPSPPCMHCQRLIEYRSYIRPAAEPTDGISFVIFAFIYSLVWRRKAYLSVNFWLDRPFLVDFWSSRGYPDPLSQRTFTTRPTSCRFGLVNYSLSKQQLFIPGLWLSLKRLYPIVFSPWKLHFKGVRRKYAADQTVNSRVYRPIYSPNSKHNPDLNLSVTVLSPEA